MRTLTMSWWPSAAWPARPALPAGSSVRKCSRSSAGSLDSTGGVSDLPLARWCTPAVWAVASGLYCTRLQVRDDGERGGERTGRRH